MPELNDTDLTKLFKTAVELDEPEESVVEGNVPEWLLNLKGSFLRVGPAKFDFDNFTLNHWLDGFAMLSKFEINGTKVTFHKKFLQSEAYQKALSAQKPLITEFATKAYPNPANKSFFSKLISSLVPFEMTDNAGTNLFQLSPTEVFATSNTTFFRKIDPCSLCTDSEKFDYQKCFGLNGVSVHPLADSNGDVYNIGFSVLPSPRYNIVKIRGHEKYGTTHDLAQHSSTICSIPSRWSASVGFFHSFGLSENFIVFVEQPYAISLTAAAKALIKGNAFKDWLEWKPTEKARFYVVDKRSGKMVKTEYVSAEAFFFLHVVNCYEEDDQIIIDLNAYGSPAVLETLYLEKLRSNEVIPEIDPPSVQRFVLPLNLTNLSRFPEGVNLIRLPNSASAAIRKGHHVILSSEILTEPGLELPVINPAFLSKKNQFFYATGTICRNSFSNAICKVDTGNKETLYWRDQDYYYPGEVVFVQRPGGTEEDDGILISACSNTQNSEAQDFLLFVDARNMAELGRAKFKADIPQSMHGLFLKSH